ncbi:MAG: DUF4831 family protein [Bacteroidota bacterium]|nr:DUF4831 family protein [Bacteroidota bacterium]
MLKNKIFFFIFILVFFACKSIKPVIKTTKITQDKDIVSSGLIYNLPRTQVIVKVHISKIVQNKGPYIEFSEKYLGQLTNVIKQNQTIWEISNIEFQTIPIVDTANIFIVSNLPDYSYLPFKLSKDGFLLSYNNNNVEYDDKDSDFKKKSNKTATNENFSFDLVSTDKNYKIVYDTIYREQVYDSIIKKVPILRPNLVRKTKGEQAKELADKLVVLRDDRAALLVGEGDSEYLPNGDALKLMLDEIDKLEASYLSMFTGKTDTLKYTFSFNYIPSNKDIDKEIIIFKFSENGGILAADSFYGTSVVLEMKSDNYTKAIKNFGFQQYMLSKDKKNKEKAGLYYRIPQKINISVKGDGKMLAEQKVYISQLGTVEFLPESLFENDELKIEFYPHLGSIKSIYY